MKLVHKIYDHLRVLYVPKCTDCWAANQNHDYETNGYRSCLTHMGRPRLIEVGCVTDSQPFKDEMILSKKKLRMVHRVRGCTGLLPGDLRDLRDELVGADRQGFQIYVMILQGINLFLRASELISIRMEDFREQLFIVNEDHVRGISIAVDGKSDYGTQYLYIWEDEECPEFFLLRHLLV
jgi:hypothetical protein